jgi:hypothetical protein
VSVASDRVLEGAGVKTLVKSRECTCWRRICIRLVKVGVEVGCDVERLSIREYVAVLDNREGDKVSESDSLGF